MTIVLVYGASLAHAQQETGSTDASKSSKAAAEESKAKPDQRKAIQPYRLDFSMSELENGKKINSRHYSMNLTAGSANEVKIGTRVPVATGGSGWQYMDVGTNIWANLRESAEDLQLDVRSDVSNLDMDSAHDHNVVSAPIVRQIKINGSTLLITGKPIIIGTMDDPNSNREFQLEVIATKLR
ncbi:MAG: hypothetical protein ACRD3P_11445 [Terriglobales bacterium]